MTPLFTDEERVQMMRDHEQRERAEQVRKHAELVANRQFVYQSRTLEEWQSRATPQTRAEKCASDRRVLVQLVAEFPDVSAEELAKASGRSTSWARKVARENGIVLAKPVRRTVQQLKGEKRNDKA
ncbi:MAG: hypothetical protein WB249_02580 [Candidatus Sulfotelmatobacter sp.]